MRGILRTWATFSCILLTIEGILGACDRRSHPAVKMCSSDQAHGSTVLVDVSGADDTGLTSCSCEVIVEKEGFLEVHAESAPGYGACLTRVAVTAPHLTPHLIRCFEYTIPVLASAQDSIQMEYQTDFPNCKRHLCSSDYCLWITNPGSSMTVKCTNTSSTMPQTSTSSTTEIPRSLVATTEPVNTTQSHTDVTTPPLPVPPFLEGLATSNNNISGAQHLNVFSRTVTAMSSTVTTPPLPPTSEPAQDKRFPLLTVITVAVPSVCLLLVITALAIYIVLIKRKMTSGKDNSDAATQTMMPKVSVTSNKSEISKSYFDLLQYEEPSNIYSSLDEATMAV